MTSEGAIDRLVRTSRWQTTVTNPNDTDATLAAVRDELRRRQPAFTAAFDATRSLRDRWRPFEGGRVMVADTNVFLHGPSETIEATDWHSYAALANVHADLALRLVVPILVVDELDRSKISQKHDVRRRARAVIRELWTLMGARPHRRVTVQERDREASRGAVTVEYLLDPPGHIRLPIADDELVERALAVQSLRSNEKVLFVTGDYAAALRASAAGLEAVFMNAMSHSEKTS